MILKVRLIPIQDDPENEKVGVGVLRPDADTHAKRRTAHRAANQRIVRGLLLPTLFRIALGLENA